LLIESKGKRTLKSFTACKYDSPVAAAHYNFSNGFSCSEAVLKAFNEMYKLNLPEDGYRIASAFGAGMGESGCACGAVSACMMTFGLIAGRKNVHESNRLAFLAANELQKEFKKLHKSVCCRVLTRDVEWESAEKKKLCDCYVKNAVEIADSIIKNCLYIG
jgi:C_GCAxxG_C_C family probable redox protein